MPIIWHVIYGSYHKFGLRHLLIALLLISYSVVGGLIFMYIEGPPDRATNEEHYRKSYKEYNDSLVKKELLRKMKKVTNKTYAKAVDWCLNENVIEKPKLKETPWTFWGSIFYASTIYTTIGYGSFAPSTTWGRVATLIYAILGIPLVITILNDWGNLMFFWTERIWNASLRWLGRNFKRKNCATRCLPQMSELGSDTEMYEVPLLLALFIFLFLICLSAGIYCIWEDWSYFTSFYYFFISLTTIGLGDVVPQNMKLAVFTLFLVLVGLAAVGMSINVMQAKVEHLFGNVEDSIDQIYKESLETGGMHGSGADVIENMGKKQSFANRMTFKFMGNRQKKILQKKWDAASKNRTKACQTDNNTADACIQTARALEQQTRFVYTDFF